MTLPTSSGSPINPVQRVAITKPSATWETRCGQAHQKRADLADEIAEAEVGRDTNQLVRKFLRDRNVRLSAALVTMGENPSEADALKLLESVNAWKSGYEPVHWFRKPKSNRETRPICCGIPHDLLAVHYMIKWCLEAQHRPPASLYGVAGKGRDDMVRASHQNIKEGYNHVEKMDIQNCFQSIAPESLYTLPLPTAVIRNALDTRNLTFTEIPAPSTILGTMVTCLNRSEPQGLMQGSPASNIILAWLLPDMPTTEDVRVLIYADNILITARTEQACRAMSDTLDQKFAGCPCGPLKLHDTVYAAPDTDVLDFLGYGLDPNGGEITISATSLTRAETKMNKSEELADEECFMQAGRLLRGLPSGFSAAPNAKSLLKIHVDMMVLHFQGRQRLDFAKMFAEIYDPEKQETAFFWKIFLQVKKPRKRKRRTK